MLSAKETRALLDGIDVSTVVGLRDRAILGVLVYSFARVSAAVALRVADYYTQGPAVLVVEQHGPEAKRSTMARSLAARSSENQ